MWHYSGLIFWGFMKQKLFPDSQCILNPSLIIRCNYYCRCTPLNKILSDEYFPGSSSSNCYMNCFLLGSCWTLHTQKMTTLQAGISIYIFTSNCKYNGRTPQINACNTGLWGDSLLQIYAPPHKTYGWYIFDFLKKAIVYQNCRGSNQ